MIEVLSAASEFYPLIKTGGLADVVSSLPAALKKHNVHMSILLPGYPSVMSAIQNAKIVHSYEDYFGSNAKILNCQMNDIQLFILDAPHLFNRPGSPYTGPDGQDWPDNGLRFAALSRTAADLGTGILAGYQPEILHLHDWQTALTPVYCRDRRGPPTVLTLHNLAFQGQFPTDLLDKIGLPRHFYSIDCLEYYGSVGFLKGGVSCASAITTVSPKYAEEICTPEFGMGLDGALRSRKALLRGIINGIDENVWDPKTDPRLTSNYDQKSLNKRHFNKISLEQHFGLDRDDSILHGVVTRLSWQKGIDFIIQSLDEIISNGARLILVGQGDIGMERSLKEASERYKGRLGIFMGYDENLAHKLFAGLDTILIPSRFEPCGLTQLYGLRYGCIPIVSRVGGLSDTIIDANHASIAAGVATGFQFYPLNINEFQNKLKEAQTLFSDKKTWTKMQRNGMKAQVSWDKSAENYASLYRSLI